MADQPLRVAAYALMGGFIVHNGDHMRRGLDGISESVVWGGTFALVVVSVALTLVLTGHRLGPWAAAASGFAIAFGVSAVHLLPDWGKLSDSLPSGSVDVFTWVAVLSEIVAAAWFGWQGLRVLQANNYQLTGARATETKEIAL